MSRFALLAGAWAISIPTSAWAGNGGMPGMLRGSAGDDGTMLRGTAGDDGAMNAATANLTEANGTRTIAAPLSDPVVSMSSNGTSAMHVASMRGSPWNTPNWNNVGGSGVLTPYERFGLQQQGWTTPCPDNYVPGVEGIEIQEHQGSAMGCARTCSQIWDCGQFAYCKHGGHHRCYLKRPFDTPETGCPSRKRVDGCTWVAQRPDAIQAPGPRSHGSPTPPPPSDPKASFYKFRVRNSFSPFWSNSEKAQSAARNASHDLGAEIMWMDVKDPSVSGISGFFLKVGLNTPVDQTAFVNQFKWACHDAGLQWGASADISEDNQCIGQGQTCPQDWECIDNPYRASCADHCCGGSRCSTDRLGQNPGFCK